MLLVPGVSAGGKGVYLKLSPTCVDDGPFACTEIAEITEVPGFVKGVVLRTSWKAIQPDEHGVFKWDALGSAIDALAPANLSVILQIDLIGGGAAGVDSTDTTDDPSLKTPEWVWDYLTDPSQYVGDIEYDDDPNLYIPRLPWVGDSEYRLLVQDVAQGLKTWLTDPNNDRSDSIEFIYVTGWQAESDGPTFYDAYVNSHTRVGFLDQLTERGALFDFDDVLIHPGSVYEDAIELLATIWNAQFTGTGIKLGVAVTPTDYSCSPVNQVLSLATTHNWVVIAPNPESNLVGLSRTETNRAFLGAIRANGRKAGIDGLAGYDPTNTTTVSGWVSAIRDCIGYEPTGGNLYLGVPGSCFIGAAGYDALSPASNATYILVDYATEYWGTSFPCITKFANVLCKN